MKKENEIDRLANIDPLQIPQTNEDGSPAIISRKIALAPPDEEFKYIVVAVAEGLLNIRVENLPDGLTYSDCGPGFDLVIEEDQPLQVATTGTITGRYTGSGEHVFTITASNDKGTATQNVTIRPHGYLAPTPPMGFMTWEYMREGVSQEWVTRTIDAMDRLGLQKLGWKYVIVDICWQGERIPGEPLHPNDKFPDIKALSDYAREKGFILGMYTAPWTKAYFELEGSGHHEEVDVKQFVDWNIGYLKLDYRPFEIKQLSIWHDLLRESGKDIVFAFSNHGLVDGGGEFLSDICDVWRTGNDITGTWKTLHRSAYNEYLNLEGYKYARKGHWPDPDMLQIGPVHDGIELPQDEQHFQMTMWSIIPSPLLLSCDLEHLNDFHIGLLTNEEVIAVNQDLLGTPARPLDDEKHILARPLNDGTWAVGFFNPTESELEISLTLSNLGFEGPQPVRDLWEKKNLGDVDKLSASVKPHCAKLFKAGNPKE